MTLSLYWMQCGACGGDTMSLLQARRPNLVELLRVLGIEVLWHPSLTRSTPIAQQELIESITSKTRTLDILCVEGAVIRGPGGTGMFDSALGGAKKDLLARLVRHARFVIAVGTCAAFGGIPAEGPTEATGLQFHKEKVGGFLGDWFLSGSGMPVINLPGCPTHPEVLTGVLHLLSRGEKIVLNALQAPEEWFSTLVHQGCTRNEYHEFRVEDADFGRPGCLYYHLGCLGPLTFGPCNKLLWGYTSGTRAGMPCIGCMRPDFPRAHPFYSTRHIEGLPLDLPEGVDRAHFLAYKTLAAAAAPARLKGRLTKV